MKVFIEDECLLHAPKAYVADGSVRAWPESPERIFAIRGALAESGAFEFLEAEAEALQAVGNIHDAGYLEFLRTIYAAWTAEVGEVEVMPDTMVPPGRRGVLRRPTNAVAQTGYYCFDLAAPIETHTWTAAGAAARCAVSAAEAVRGGAAAAYALGRPPGHHAGRDYCGGFCYLNNAAIAAEQLRLTGAGRVAILDVDYHHGNGTQDIFYGRKDVLFVSLHADPNTQYPYFWGHAEESGEGEGEGYTVNFPLARRTGEAEWFLTLAQALMHVQMFGPDALVVSLGVDTAMEDGVGDFGLRVESFTQLGQMLRTLKVPTVFVQEGGYNLKQIGECVRNALSGFGGDE